MTPAEIDARMSELRDHARAMDNQAAAMRDTNKLMREMPGVVGKELRDTADYVVWSGSKGGGGLIILWFIIKLILLFLAAKK